MAFDVIDSHRLVAEVDCHLRDHLHDITVNGELSKAPGTSGDDNDVDAAPVLLWHVGADGHTSALGRLDDPPSSRGVVPGRKGDDVTPGLDRVPGAGHAMGHGWLVAGQSLTETGHVKAVLIAGEAIAGPIVLIAMFFGALIIGLKASRPVELARRKQLEFTADASHELRTPLSVIEAEVTLALSTPRDAARYRDALQRVNGESKRLRRIIDDLLWLARFDSEPTPPGPRARRSACRRP